MSSACESYAHRIRRGGSSPDSATTAIERVSNERHRGLAWRSHGGGYWRSPPFQVCFECGLKVTSCCHAAAWSPQVPSLAPLVRLSRGLFARSRSWHVVCSVNIHGHIIEVENPSVRCDSSSRRGGVRCGNSDHEQRQWPIFNCERRRRRKRLAKQRRQSTRDSSHRKMDGVRFEGPRLLRNQVGRNSRRRCKVPKQRERCRSAGPLPCVDLHRDGRRHRSRARRRALAQREVGWTAR